LAPASLSYPDIVAFLQQAEDGASASVLRSIFSGMQSEALLVEWLAKDSRDEELQVREAVDELQKLIEARLGLAVAGTEAVATLRSKVSRYLLVNEFRSDLQGDAPDSVAMVPKTTTKEQVERVREVAARLRRDHADRYAVLADAVVAELSLEKAQLDPAGLGNIDTFRFEERALLRLAGELVCQRDYSKALGIVADRRRSFWVDREVSRLAQWEACRLIAELGREIERARSGMDAVGVDPAKWVQAYAAEDGWHRVDLLQRRLETWVAKMDEDAEVSKALGLVRREHEELLKRMADGFAKSFQQSGWVVPGALHQTRVYPDVVQAMGGRVAYFFVDAMRYEMGIELANQLEGTTDLTIRPAIAALPTITPVGMAALLPGAAASFSVVEVKGGLAASIEGSTMAGLTERSKFLKAKVPGIVDMPLGKLLGSTPAKLVKAVGDAPLVLVRSQEIDALGENVDELTARAAMESVIGNVARAVRKLAVAGVENFVITADHGHQFSLRKEDDMKTDNPGGDTVDLHRRCWIGHGGTTPAGTVRVSGAELGYDTNLDFVFPTGLGVFKAGGGLTFHHGSISLQELVVPVVTLRMKREQDAMAPDSDLRLSGLPDKLTNRTFGVRLRVEGGLFATDLLKVRVVLMADGEQAGECGMAVGAELDRATGLVAIKPGVEASLGMMLTREDCASIRVVVQDPQTDAVLVRSDEILVKLGM
ncbi:MAG: PglZ domain-containing protein, partial [Dehalococcoidia bacterium]